MASADVVLKHDEPNRLSFAHSPLRSLTFALVSFGFTALCYFVINDAPAVRWGFVGFSLLFVAAGIAGVFWRLELDIDLAMRKVRIRRGMWPATKTTYRSLDEADEVWLTMKFRSSGSKNKNKNKNKSPWWFVSLKFPEEKKGIRIAASSSAVDGYERCEHYATRLQLDAVDATDKKSLTRKSWERLDENLMRLPREERPESEHVPHPPAGSSIELLWSTGGREILLPALGFSGGLVFLAAFGGIFAAIGSLALMATQGVINMPIEGSDTALMIVPPVFIVVGLGIIWLGIKGSYSATVIGVEGASLYKEYAAFGKRSGRK
ncbi:MAG: hypothetical protein ACJ0SL_00485 [Candidatus Rariloculaceae bacterium]